MLASVAISYPWLLIGLEISLSEMSILLKLSSARCGKLERRWLLLSNVKFAAKIQKYFPLSVKNEMTSGTFIIVPFFIIVLVVFQNWRDPICLFSTFACIDHG